jgi:hypothetical protein
VLQSDGQCVMTVPAPRAASRAGSPVLSEYPPWSGPIGWKIINYDNNV